LTEEDGFAFSLGWQRKWGFYMPLYVTPAVNVVQGWSETAAGVSLKVETNKDFYSAYGIISLSSTDNPLVLGVGGTLYIY
jgi:hypothetical protein